MKTDFIISIPEYDGIGVYALINNENGKLYIGSSQNIRRRITQHKVSPPSALKQDIEKGNTFSVKILEKLPYGCNQFDMFSREAHFIRCYDTLNQGYNRAKTTCSTKEELLTSLECFKNNSKMSNYIKNIISKRECPIYPKHNSNDTTYRISINATLFAEIKAHAANHSESVNAFINRAINETMERDNA